MIITITHDEFIVGLEGYERIWAMKFRLIIPRDSITKVEYSGGRPGMKGRWLYLRLFGTGLPGYLLAGTFFRPGRRNFWFLRMRQKGFLSINLKHGSFAYDNVSLSCDPLTGKKILATK